MITLMWLTRKTKKFLRMIKDVLLTNKDYTAISKSDDHSVADGTVVNMF